MTIAALACDDPGMPIPIAVIKKLQRILDTAHYTGPHADEGEVSPELVVFLGDVRDTMAAVRGTRDEEEAEAIAAPVFKRCERLRLDHDDYNLPDLNSPIPTWEPPPFNPEPEGDA